MRLNKILVPTGLCFLVVLGAYLGQRYYAELRKDTQERLVREARDAAWQSLQQGVLKEISRFGGEAGIMIVDLATGKEIAHNKTKLFPSASLAKIPLMAACFAAADQGRLNLDREVALKSSDKFDGSGVLKDIRPGTTVSVERLIGFMIYDSDNTATNIITDLLGLDYLNSVFRTFGLKNTELSRKIADYRLRDKGIENYTTAEDMALLLNKIYRKELVNRNVSDRCIGTLKLTRMNDRIPKYLPPEIAVAHKTGLENGVCHDAGIVFTRKGDFIIVVLTRHANINSNASKEFIAGISLSAYKYFERLP